MACRSEGAAVSSRRLPPGSSRPRRQSKLKDGSAGTRPGMTAIMRIVRAYSSAASRGLSRRLPASSPSSSSSRASFRPILSPCSLARRRRARRSSSCARSSGSTGRCSCSSSTTTGSCCRGDLGTSLFTTRPVWDDLSARLPATIELTIAAMIVAVVLGIPLGVVCGALPQSDRRPRAAHRHGRGAGGGELLAGADAAAVFLHGSAAGCRCRPGSPAFRRRRSPASTSSMP